MRIGKQPVSAAGRLGRRVRLGSAGPLAAEPLRLFVKPLHLFVFGETLHDCPRSS